MAGDKWDFTTIKKKKKKKDSLVKKKKKEKINFLQCPCSESVLHMVSQWVYQISALFPSSQSVLPLSFIYLCLETECLLPYISVRGSALMPLVNNEFLPVPGGKKDGCPSSQATIWLPRWEESQQGTDSSPQQLVTWLTAPPGSCLQSPACLWSYMPSERILSVSTPVLVLLAPALPNS